MIKTFYETNYRISDFFALAVKNARALRVFLRRISWLRIVQCRYKTVSDSVRYRKVLSLTSAYRESSFLYRSTPYPADAIFARRTVPPETPLGLFHHAAGNIHTQIYRDLSAVANERQPSLSLHIAADHLLSILFFAFACPSVPNSFYLISHAFPKSTDQIQDMQFRWRFQIDHFYMV